MAHQIETHNNQAAAVFARTDAWHRLGTTVAGRAFTAEEAMTLGHLGGWDVRTLPLTAHEVSPHGVASVEVPGAFATVRTNPFTGASQALGVVGSAYRPLQNEAHADFLNTLADTAGASFDTAGSLHGGRQVFITMALPETMQVGGVDPVGLNLAALNSHDGSSAFRLLVTPVRVVCANTQAAALAGAKVSWSIRHTAGARGHVQAAREALGLTFAYATVFQAEAEHLINTTMSQAQFHDLTAHLFGPVDPEASPRARAAHRTRAEVLGWLWDDAPTQAGIRGTAWAGYQVITEYLDHYAPVKTRTGKEVARAVRVLTSPQPTKLKHTAWATLTGPTS